MMDMMKCVVVRTAAGTDQKSVQVTECNSCSYYNRGECGMSGLPMHPEDFCSRAVKAE